MQGLSHVVKEDVDEAGERYEVPVIRLDDQQELQESAVPVTGLKMDIEDHEFEALKGARELLQRFKPIIYIELWESENRNNCFALLEQLGYTANVSIAGKLHVFDPARMKTQYFIFTAH